MKRFGLILFLALIAVGLVSSLVVPWPRRAAEQQRASSDERLAPRRSPPSDSIIGLGDPTETASPRNPPSVPMTVQLDLDGRAEISGRVVAPDERPLPGARVQDSEFPWESRSDEDGRFVFRGLLPGEHTLLVQHAKYARATYGPVKLDANHALGGVEIRLSEGGSVAGSVTDRDGSPVWGARVLLEMTAGPNKAVEDLAEQFLASLVAETDEGGEYVSEVLLPGTYRVEPFGCEELAVEPQVVEVNAGKTAAGIDFVLSKATHIAGRCVDWDGNPVADVQLSSMGYESPQLHRQAVSNRDGAFVLGGLIPGRYFIQAQCRGYFRLEGVHVAPADDLAFKLRQLAEIRGQVIDKLTQKLVEMFGLGYYDYHLGLTASESAEHPKGRFKILATPGKHKVCVVAQGYAPSVKEGIRALEGIEPGEVVFELVRGLRLTFHVMSGEDGEPVAGATIRYNRAEDLFVHKDNRPEWLELTTDESGSCLARHFPPGRHEFTVAHPDFLEKRVTVTADEWQEEVTAEVMLDEGLVLRGRVITKAEQEPVHDAEAFLVPAGDTSTRAWWARKRSTRTDASGAFKFEGVAPGHYSLDVEQEEYAPFHQDLSMPEDIDGEVLVELGKGGKIVGVVASSDGLPVEGAVIVVRTPFGSGTSSATGPDGHYEVAGIAPGPCCVGMATADFFLDNGVEVGRTGFVRESEETRIDVILGGVAIFGTITFEGEPVAHLPVRARLKALSNSLLSDSLVSSSRTDNEGRYRLEDLRSGVYQIGEGYPIDTLLVEVHQFSRFVRVGEDDVQCDIELSGDSIVGAVELHNGWPAANARAVLMVEQEDEDRVASIGRVYESVPEGGLGDKQANTDVNGAFAFDGISPGSYRLVVDKEGYAVRVLEIHKMPNKDISNLKIILEPEATVIVNVHTDDNRPPHEIWLAVCDERGRLLGLSRNPVDTASKESPIYGLGPGRFMIGAWSEAHAVSREKMAVEKGGESQIDLHIKRGRRFAVRVFDAIGETVPGAEVILDPGGDVSVAALLVAQAGLRATSGEDGLAVFEHVADSDYTIRVHCDPFEDAAAPVRIAGADQQITVTLTPAQPDAQ